MMKTTMKSILLCAVAIGFGAGLMGMCEKEDYEVWLKNEDSKRIKAAIERCPKVENVAFVKFNERETLMRCIYKGEVKEVCFYTPKIGPYDKKLDFKRSGMKDSDYFWKLLATILYLKNNNATQFIKEIEMWGFGMYGSEGYLPREMGLLINLERFLINGPECMNHVLVFLPELSKLKKLDEIAFSDQRNGNLNVYLPEELRRDNIPSYNKKNCTFKYYDASDYDSKF